MKTLPRTPLSRMWSSWQRHPYRNLLLLGRPIRGRAVCARLSRYAVLRQRCYGRWRRSNGLRVHRPGCGRHGDVVVKDVVATERRVLVDGRRAACTTPRSRLAAQLLPQPPELQSLHALPPSHLEHLRPGRRNRRNRLHRGSGLPVPKTIVTQTSSLIDLRRRVVPTSSVNHQTMSFSIGNRRRIAQNRRNRLH